MLHELLLALVGCTGDFIIDGREEEQNTASSQSLDEVAEECTFKLAPDLAFLQDSEREILERLIRLGFFYRELDRFAVKSRNLSWITCANHDFQIQDPVEMKGKKRPPSVYRRALANGISEVLSIYRSAVLQVEQNFLADPVPVLASVTQGLNKFEVLLPPLHSFILEVERKDIRGGCLLNLLHKKCHCGVPELQACMQRLLWHGHQVMYRQLAAWMVYGILQDQHEEFFIRRQHGGNSDAPDRSAKDVHLSDWHTGFHVSLEMKPEYIQMQVAESILFVGKAIRVLRNPSPSFRSQDSESHQQSSKTANKTSATTGVFPLQNDSLLAMNHLNDAKLLPQSEADKITAMLQELKDLPEFHKRSFEYAVDSIRTIAAAHLWQLVVVHADLNGHLKALKDYFLLAKGDFFQCFLEESRSLMRLPPRPGSAETDLKVPFQQVVETRFASNTIVLRRLVKVRESLASMVISQSWSLWRQSSTVRATNVKLMILDDTWWERVEYLLSFTEPIMSMIRYTDMDHPCLGEVYDGIDSMLEKMKHVINEKEQDPEETFFKEVQTICVERWNKMTTPLHLLAFALTPKLYSDEILSMPSRVPPYRDAEVSEGCEKALTKLFPDREMENIVTREVADFVASNGQSASTLRDKYTKDAHAWWYLNGHTSPHLQTLAIKPLSQAAVKTIGDDDKYFTRVSLRMPLLESLASTSKGDISRLKASGDGNSISLSNIYGNSTAGASLDGWDGIVLEYSVDWPLQLLFTREVLAKYCKVFQYLIRLKRIQLELEKSWAEAMQQDHADSALERKDRTNRLVSQQRRQQRMPMWRVRQHMTYLITNLQFYIQVDVIESQWNLLQERVETSKDFTELTKYHQEYLSALISQSFLDIGSVSRILDSIIKLCLQLCRIIEQYEGNPNMAELEHITEEFNKKSNSLYTILRSSKLAGSQRAPFLRQFLLRLNYNSFFEATARGALNVVRPRPSLSAAH